LFSLSPLQRPPSSTLFPYRRSSDLLGDLQVGLRRRYGGARLLDGGGELERLHLDEELALRDEVAEVGAEALDVAAHLGEDCDLRSEEHTSELQSRSDLVCRLLLEKK